MDQNQLLSSAVELALDLLEKNGSFLPFCKAVNDAGETFIYSPASDSDFSSQQAYDSVLLNVKRDLSSRGLKGVAFCFDSRVRLSDSPDKVPAIEVEVHYRGEPSGISYFLYEMEGTTANISNYFTNPLDGSLFAE